MKFLILGNSSIARRRVLPALASLGVAAEVVSRPHYESAIDATDADAVYVSTVNSAHAEFAARALDAGRHVVVDKPITTSLEATLALLAKARQRGLLLAEATVWTYHPQVLAVRRAFEENGLAPERLVGVFSFPRIAEGNYRHVASLGGGVLLDVGPYAITPGRLFFEAAPLEVLARATTAAGDEVESAFGILAMYPGARSTVGHYGMTTAYLNRLDVLGRGISATLEPAFTTAADAPCSIRLNVGNVRRTIEVAAADAFALFLADVRSGIEAGDHARFRDAIAADALALDALRQASSRA
jgi:predicted dehydrogenase